MSSNNLGTDNAIAVGTVKKLEKEISILRRRLAEFEEREAECSRNGGKLAQSEERFRSLVRNVSLGVFRSTPGKYGRFIEVNPAMEAITGYSRLELLGLDVSQL